MKRLVPAALLLSPTAVMAHPGHHDQVAWTHLLVSADHLSTVAMIAALGGAVWLVLRGRS